MEIRFDIKKKYFLLILTVILVSGGFIIATATPPTQPNPGHPASEIGTGTADTGLFTGNSVSIWKFPGEVRIGGGSGDVGLLVLYPGDAGAWLGIQNNALNDALEFGWTDSNTFNSYMSIKNGGNVGIGIVNPSSKLHVSGNVMITGNLVFAPGSSITLPASSGTDGDGDTYILLNQQVSATVITSSGVQTTTIYGDDCDDTDGDAYPGQQQYFNSPRNGGGFDYNCNGQIEYQVLQGTNCAYINPLGLYYRSNYNPDYFEYTCTSSSYQYLKCISSTVCRCYEYSDCGAGSGYINALGRDAYRR